MVRNHYSCCVVNCKNTGRNSNCKFYTFPTASWKLEKRKKWINAVKRKNADGSPWTPKRTDTICSEHFIGGKKSEEEASSSYIPTIFSTVCKKPKIIEKETIKRDTRVLNSRKNIPIPVAIIINNSEVESENNVMDYNEIDPLSDVKIDKDCQAEFFSNSNEIGKTFICNKYMYLNAEKCDAEIQTEIIKAKSKIIISRKKCKNKECNTPIKQFVDQSTETSEKMFLGFESISKDEQLIDLAGITLNNFNFLLKRTDTLQKYTVPSKDRLLIFLMKIKTGLTFSALSVLFNVHRTTISRIFHSTLQTLITTTANLVFWPKLDIVRATMPKSLYPRYTNTRVIIDCTEINKAKVLIGITPGGFICFKSKVEGGRKTDSEIASESGFIDKLEEGDIVLINKGFTEIKTKIAQSGKNVRVIMPPVFEETETEETYHVARVRIHVERIMQRLRVHSILDKISDSLFHCIDDILHICCVLVNLQSPVITNKENLDE